jgi:hypothetical protein
MQRDYRYNAVRVLVAAPKKIIEMGGSFRKRVGKNLRIRAGAALARPRTSKGKFR